MLKQNVGTTDRIVRLVLAAGLFSLFFVLQAPLSWLGLVGLVPLLTALAGSCPIYTLLGVGTCPVPEQG